MKTETAPGDTPRDGGDPDPLQEPARREFQELWFSLARRDWRSVVLVPTDEGRSAAMPARRLAQVGRQLHEFPVTLFVMENPADYWPAMQIVQTAASTDQGDAALARVRPLDYATAVEVVAKTAHEQAARPRTGKVIVAIQPVTAEPLGLAVTQAADLIVLHIEVGVTRLSSARRTIDLIGRDRIAGCFLDYSAMAR